MKLKELMDRSRIIVALDFLNDKVLESMQKIMDYIAAVKIGIPTILSEHYHVLRDILKNRKTYVLVDFKLADIPPIMSRVIEKLSPLANGFIAHAFVGKHALENLRQSINRYNAELFLVVAMTHPGAEEFINKNFMKFLEIASDIADGVVAPATYPIYIREARKYLGDKIIISPGIGRQGVKYGEAIKNGADFEIIGRSITLSDDPIAEIQRILAAHSDALKEKDES